MQKVCCMDTRIPQTQFTAWQLLKRVFSVMLQVLGFLDVRKSYVLVPAVRRCVVSFSTVFAVDGNFESRRWMFSRPLPASSTFAFAFASSSNFSFSFATAFAFSFTFASE